MPPVSVLDLNPISEGRGESAALRESIDLAQATERLGFHRFWLAEHHGGRFVASSAPEIMIGAIAARTERIRVGSGGMMLPNHRPLHVAEQFKVLAALHPERIDLGIGRAPGTDPMTAYALRGTRQGMGDVDLGEQLTELFTYSGYEDLPEGHPLSHVRAAPDDAPLPPVFLLGSSDYSARLAAELGLGFAFAAQINPEGAVSTLRMYRERFKPSRHRDQPLGILCHNVVVADDDEQAKRLASPARVAFRRLRTGAPTPLPSVDEAVAEDRPQRPPTEIEAIRMITGSPPMVREILDELLSRSGADELMVMTSTHSYEDRLHSYELLAQTFQLDGASALTS